MNLHLSLANLANYSAQIALLVAMGSLAPRLLRLRRPGVLLAYRHALLAACLLLPVLQPARRPVIESYGDISISAGVVAHIAPARGRVSLEEFAASLLCLGILGRLAWLALGLRRLGRYRRRARLLSPPPPVFAAPPVALRRGPEVYLSDEVSGPVAFGFRRPAILLPPEFLSAPASARQAIACHELIHLRRGDWAAAMLEEIVRALFWFHPAIWWLLAEIQLSREQTVDAEALRITAAPEQYIDALLAVAAGRLQPDLAPAPLFLRKNHLTQRVSLILKEVTMSKRRLLSSLAAACGALVLTARFAVLLFPISAPAQEVLKGDAHLLHRTPVIYPPEAREQGVQGTVVVQATLNDRGVVTDARVVSGPEPLRKAALRSVLDWHYAPGSASPMEVAIDFKPAPDGPAAVAVAPAIEPGTLKEIRYSGLTAPVREAVASSLPVHEGDAYSADALARIREVARRVDEHLTVTHQRLNAGQSPAEYSLRISYAPTAPQRIRVGGNVQSAQLITKVMPKYPPDAKLARIQGKVRLNVVINKDGTVQDVQIADGDPALTETAVEAVRQWVYKPTLLNGQPVEVQTVVDVNFTLLQ